MTGILISFFLIMAGGIFFKWRKPAGIDPDNARHVINTIVINFFLPALCFKVIATSVIDINTVLLPLSGIITILLSIAFSFAVYAIVQKFTKLDQKNKAALVIAASFGNVTFLGLPILTGLYGDDAAQYVLLYDLMATTPLLWLVGAAIASSYGSGRKLTIKESLKVLAELPPIWALILGFIANIINLKIPGFLLTTLDMLSMPIVPLMIFSIGLALQMPKAKETIVAVPAIIIKLCIVPFIAYIVALLLGMNGLPLKATVMEAAMPTMVLSLVIASQYKLDHKLSALVIVLTTAASFITIPLISYLISGY